MHLRKVALITAVVVVGATGASVAAVAQATTTPPVAKGKSASDIPIAQYLQQTMDDLAFQEVLDLAPPAAAQASTLKTVDKDATASAQAATKAAAVAAAQPISQQPQIDATVLELDSAGRIVSSGTVLMSPQYPHGVVVPVDANHHTTAVRYRQWDDAGWYANKAQGTIDIVPGRESAALDFMSPYPASLRLHSANALRMLSP